MRLLIALLLTCLAAPVLPSAAPGDVDALLRDIRTLSDPQMQGRGSGTKGAKRARQFIAARFEALGLEPAGALPDFFHPFHYGRAQRRGTNVIAALPGCARSEALIVVTAHYDHLGQRRGRTYHGADDNASGVAALLWLAQRLASEPRSNRCWWFVATDAEESGLHGSEALFESQLLRPGTVAANLNLDMVARGERGWRLHLSGTHRWPGLRRQLNDLNLELHLDYVGKRGPRGLDGSALSTNWYAVSDHGPFVERDLPHVFIGGMDHTDYHEPSDQWQAINPAYLAEVLVVIASTADWLSRARLD